MARPHDGSLHMSRAKVHDRNLVGSSTANHPLQEPPRQRKTKSPPAMRQRPPPQKENREQNPPTNSSTRPTVSAKYAGQLTDPEFATALITQLQSLIDHKNWSALGDLIEDLTKNACIIGHAPLAMHPVVNDFRLRAAIDVLMAEVPRRGEQISLALDLLSMGADWNAQDEHGNNVLNILRSEMDPQVQQFVASEYPSFRHLFMDHHGRPIPAKIKPGGHDPGYGAE